MKANKKGWFMFYYRECPMCGRNHEGKEYIKFKTKKKPKNKVDRSEYTKYWCGCGI